VAKSDSCSPIFASPLGGKQGTACSRGVQISTHEAVQSNNWTSSSTSGIPPGFTEQVGYDTRSLVRVSYPYSEGDAPWSDRGRACPSRDSVPISYGSGPRPPWSRSAGRACRKRVASEVFLADPVGAPPRRRVAHPLSRRAAGSSRASLFGTQAVGRPSFPGLWEDARDLRPDAVRIADRRTPPPSADEDAILLRLNRHLEELSQGLAS